ncbi:uncharacterized protein LOC34620553 [Cyclospora cayetanensis]|nr:uncharacterized protein LOC34620553 [Cyclospora cayetanensis]
MDRMVSRLVKESEAKEDDAVLEVAPSKALEDLRDYRDAASEKELAGWVLDSHQYQEGELILTPKQQCRAGTAIRILLAQSKDEKEQEEQIFSVTGFDSAAVDMAGTAVLATARGDTTRAVAAAAAEATVTKFRWIRILGVTNVSVTLEVEPLEQEGKKTVTEKHLAMSILIQSQQERERRRRPASSARADVVSRTTTPKTWVERNVIKNTVIHEADEEDGERPEATRRKGEGLDTQQATPQGEEDSSSVLKGVRPNIHAQGKDWKVGAMQPENVTAGVLYQQWSKKASTGKKSSESHAAVGTRGIGEQAKGEAALERPASRRGYSRQIAVIEKPESPDDKTDASKGLTGPEAEDLVRTSGTDEVTSLFEDTHGEVGHGGLEDVAGSRRSGRKGKLEGTGTAMGRQSSLDTAYELPKAERSKRLYTEGRLLAALQLRGESGQETLERTGLLIPMYGARLQHPGDGDISGTESIVFDRRIFFSSMMNSDLGELMTRAKQMGRPLSQSVILHVIKRTMLAVGALHESSCLHNNLQLESITISAQGLSYLSDFRAATIMGETSDPPDFSLLAPEQLDDVQQGSAPTHTRETDSWQLGSVAFLALTGEPPFTPEQQQLFTSVFPKRNLPASDKPGGTKNVSRSFERKATSYNIPKYPVEFMNAYKSPYEILKSHNVPDLWATLVSCLLQPDPTIRPTVRQVINAFPKLLSLSNQEKELNE